MIEPSPLNESDVQRLSQVRELLRQHLESRSPKIPVLARGGGMSPSKLRQSFKAFFGKSIHQYYLSLKMELAKYKLEEESLSISELGYSLGYSNISHFIRAFKNHFGQTPAAYRSWFVFLGHDYG